ncbi:MFS transporter [Micromonospora sp. HM5-17]|uniref:MFS transporter n=1 Tax=Micromonospora sp. HM5-17 TaxID=2487710 RepID=UPI000F4803F5|nr:MFS transporter [Micromonospora sp. HM5-17]ROT32989.1 MFS transporter [Micromonospora sp. HM5-17]
MSTVKLTRAHPGTSVVDRRALTGGFAFTAYSNTLLQLVLTMVPVAVLHGDRVQPAVFSYLLSLHVAAGLLASMAAPLLLARARPGQVLVLSSLLRAAGYGTLILSAATPALYAFALLTGVGLGVSRPAIRLLLNHAAGDGGRARVFQIFFLILNGAFVLAPILAEAGRGHALATLAVVTVVEIAGSGLVYTTTARAVATDASVPAGLTWRARWGLLLRPHVLVTIAYTLICYFSMGFVVTMFLLYDSVTPELAEYRALFLSFEPLALVGIQLALVPLFSRFGRRALYLLAGLTLGPGMALAFGTSLWLVFTGLVLFAFAESLAMPKIQVEAGEAAPPGQQAAVFTLVAVATAVGEILGNLAAGLTVQQPADRALDPGTAGMATGALMTVLLLAAGVALIRLGTNRPREA